MESKKNHDEQLENIMNQLADSVLELSEDAILAEIRETGANPEEEAERTHAIVQQASKALEAVNKRLWSLGHTVNPKHWQQAERGYHNKCRHCGLSVNFTLAGNEMWGDALVGTCSETGQYAVRKLYGNR